MAGEIPLIQVLSRNNYEDQHVVALPEAYPLPALPPSSLRVKSSILSLTTNNFSYARVGHMLGWWDIHLLPESIPAEYADPKKFGRISAWGYGTVTESTVPDVEVGTQLYGYLPIGTLPVDIEVQLAPNAQNQVLVTSKHRQHVLPVYNRYLAYPPAKNSEEASKIQQDQGFDALMQVLFETGYMMNRFALAWDPAELVHPSDPKTGWTSEKADVGPKTTVVIFSPSGKTALAFAHQLKHGRPAGKVPHAIIGVGSAASQAFSEGTGLYDKVLIYEADSGDLPTELGLHPDSKLVICDFGARGNAPARWVAKLQPTYNGLLQLNIGGEVVADSPEKITEKMMARRGGSQVMVNASVLRSQAMAILGEEKYFEEFIKEWKAFRAQGVKGLSIVWGNGMDDVKKGWEDLYKGKVGPNQGLVFKL